MPSQDKPQLFIITGSNGAGKSTLKQALLPNAFAHLGIFDGDIFFTQKKTAFYKKFKNTKEARKLADEALEEHFLQLVTTHIEKREHFAYEGHFTGSGAWTIPERFKAAGFQINLIFCGLNAVMRSIQRVDIRVKKNGFHVSPLDIENNFYGNMQMVNRNFKLLDTIEILDTSNNLPVHVCSFSQGACFTLLQDEDIPKWFKTGFTALYDLLMSRNSENG